MLQVRDLTVRFGQYTALDRINLEFFPGEVHAVVGQNGAGKSTLMNVLCGALKSSSGDVLLADEPSNSTAYSRQGVSIVHQQSQLVEALTVSDNIYLGRRKKDASVRFPRWLRTRSRQRDYVSNVLNPFGIAHLADELVRNLGTGERQLAEIARAVYQCGSVLILDEPTASLGHADAAKLFTLIRGMARDGVTVILIAHSLEEVMSVADRITILRDGKLVQTVSAQEVDRSALVKLIVGHALDESEQRKSKEPRPFLECADLLADGNNARIPLRLRASEILGIPTYVGAMTDSVIATLSGEDAGQHSISIENRPVRSSGIRSRVLEGICLVPGDALKEGVVGSMTVLENIIIANPRTFSRFGFIRQRAARKAAMRLLEQLDIRPRDLDMPTRQMSGGNRQKVVIAKWIAAGAKVLLMNDPTKAVDVGAKRDIYRLIEEAAQKGTAILLVSSDVDELIAVADRIDVLHQGRLKASFTDRPFDKAAVLDQMP